MPLRDDVIRCEPTAQPGRSPQSTHDAPGTLRRAIASTPVDISREPSPGDSDPGAIEYASWIPLIRLRWA
jgi:hypothetical protein